MSASSDIANLFKKFGGNSTQYQEITQAEAEETSQKRWPSMFKGRSKDGAASVHDEQEPVVEAPAATDNTHSAEQAESQPKPAPAPEHQVKPAPAEVNSWSSAGLQSLLAKLAQEASKKPSEPESEPESASVEAAPVVTADEVRQPPQLENIKVIAVVSGKGGVGKSTMAANLSAALRKVGRPVLAIDLDPQNALHNHFQPASEVSDEQGVVRFEQDWREQVVPSKDGVFVLPYGVAEEAKRHVFEAVLSDDPLWLAYQLSDLELADGAVVVIDTPPGPSIYLEQALAVANVALVVSLADAASYTALPMIDRLIATYTEGREDFAGAAYVVNQVDHSRQLSKDITHVMQNLLGNRLIGQVHRDQSIGDALAYNRNVMDYDPHGRGSHDILDCTMALISYLSPSTETE